MKNIRNKFIVSFIAITTILQALPENVISIHQNMEYETIVVVDAQTHIAYGFSFPLTFEFTLPDNITKINALKKYSRPHDWITLEVMTSEDFFNHIETVRFDSINNKAYVSIGFGSETDSIFIKIVDEVGNNINVTFNQITKYYDNRKAAVTSSADDMANWSLSKFNTTIKNFLKYDLYITLGMNTNGMSEETYDFLQDYINTGFVEAGAHSRTHPDWASYSNYDSEITGCKEDIINNLDMPPLYRNGENEYVYSWIAPNGYLDDIIDSLVGQNKYLVNRLYYGDYEGFAEWNSENDVYFPIGVTRAIDPPRSRLGWGIGTDDIDDLNNKFDEVISNGSVYHVMCHPNVIEWNKSYTWEHLEHISRRNNLWYVTLGHVYLYHLAHQNYTFENTVNVTKSEIKPTEFKLYQNYPNPFNNGTNISFYIPNGIHISIKLYNLLGQEMEIILNEFMNSGIHSVNWVSKNIPSGLYIYTLRAGDFVESKKIMLLK